MDILMELSIVELMIFTVKCVEQEVHIESAIF